MSNFAHDIRVKMMKMKQRDNKADYRFKGKCAKIYLIILLVMMAAGESVVCSAQQIQVITNYPNFAKSFEILEKNRLTYNRLNDSILLIKNHERWVNFFRERSLKNHQLFAANKEILRSIFDYFKANKGHIPEQAYVDLYFGADQLDNDRSGDPFIAKRICDLLEQHYKETEVPDSVDFSGWVDVIQGVNYYNISLLGQDSVMARKAYEYFLKAASITKLNNLPAIRAKIEGLLNLCYTNWMTRNFQTITEFRQCVSLLDELTKDSTISKKCDEAILKAARNLVLTADERLLRNVYFSDSTVLDKQVADSLMRGVIAKNERASRMTDLTFSRIMLMKVKLGQMTYADAMKLVRERYLSLKKELDKGLRLNRQELTAKLQPILTYFYINDMAHYSLAKKRKYAREMCEVVLLLYQHRKDQQYDNNYVKLLNTMVTYPRAIKYLTAKERIFYLNSLNVATQVTTYAHSVHVSMIAEELMKGILAYQPELLVGALGDLQVSDILANKKKYIDFAHDAAMYHDLGKNSIISVVNNDYRPLTDEEYAIIKRHPELGLQYLELAPSLKKFHDTTLGHHKWYNGKGGYPMSFDNTKSPMRILIDMVTLSDCMQAATERVGRNYKGEKNFDTVMAEFRRDAGVRYNPDLVALIDAHPDLAKKLADLINEGWVEIYYNIYSQFIR